MLIDCKNSCIPNVKTYNTATKKTCILVSNVVTCHYVFWQLCDLESSIS